MATRRPVIWDTALGGLRVMTSAEVNEIVAQVSYQYSLNPSVKLTVLSDSGNLGNMVDTRMTAGAMLSWISSYPTEAYTEEPGETSITFNKIYEEVETVYEPSPAIGKTLPLYWTGSVLKRMSDEDFYNTFIEPAIDNLVSSSTGTAQGGTYQIYTATSLSGNTIVDTEPVFIDTRANTGAYTAAGIPEALDQPTTINSYYLFQINGAAASYKTPFAQINNSSQFQIYTKADFDNMLQRYVRYAAANRPNYKIRYSLSTGNNRGSGMANTKLNGSGNRQVRFVAANDYRAQEFPNGSAATVSTYYLKVGKSA